MVVLGPTSPRIIKLYIRPTWDLHMSVCTHICIYIYIYIYIYIHIISAATDPNSVGCHQPACSRFCKRNRKGNLARLKQCPGVGQAHLYGKKAVAKARAIGAKTCCVRTYRYLFARKDSAGDTTSAVRRDLVTQLLRFLRAHVDFILFAQIIV